MNKFTLIIIHILLDTKNQFSNNILDLIIKQELYLNINT